MLNIGKLGGGAGGADYYLGKVASGVEDYYTGAGEAPGYWTGAGADALGLSGEVGAPQLHTLLGGADPVSSEWLGRRRNARSVPGFDLAFRAPKSVSLVWALAGDEAMREAREAHDHAVAEALAYLEDHACGSRHGAEGEPVDARGFVGAAFRHRSSRAGDPLLHTHVVVANAVQSPDGAWRTLDARRLYTHAKTAGCVYQAVLRGELTRRLGLEWTPVTNGVADVRGVPRHVIDAFSQRRTEIVEHMNQRGETSAKAAQAATLHTRRAKDYGVDGDSLTERWQARGQAHGWGRDQATACIGPPRQVPALSDETTATAVAELAGPNGLTAQQASFTRRDVVRAWSERLRDGATSRAELERLADRTLDSDAGVAVPLATVRADTPGADAARDVVDAVAQRLGEPAAAEVRTSPGFHHAAAAAVLTGGAPADQVAAEVCRDSLAGARDPAAVLTWRAQRTAARLVPEDAAGPGGDLDGHAVIRRSDGRLVAGAPGETRYSTPELLALEQRTIQAAVNRRDADVARVGDQTVQAAVARRPALTEPQQRMVTQLTTSGHGVDVVVGKAGAGKTLALDAAREAWQADGHRVVGTALAARAASELHAGAGIDSYTLDGLLADVDRFGAGDALPYGGVVIVDEAGMVGTRALARVLDAAEQAERKVVLVGDDRQLPEIDAGGVYRGLTRRLDAVELTDNRRQVHQWERDALDQLRHGDPPEALRAYQANQRVTVADTADDARAQLTADWWAARRAHGRDAGVMIALRLTDVDDLNARARAHRRAAGELTGPTVAANDGREFAAGDDVLCLRNDRRLGLVNGTRGVLTHVDPKRGSATVDTANGRRVDLPGTYVADRLAHAYATTAHKAQGQTTERAWVLGSDEVYREWGYVACSRARQATYLYVAGGDAVDDAHTHQGAPNDDPLARFSHGLDRSRAQHAATDEAAAAIEEARRRATEFEAQATAAQQRARDTGAGLTAARRRARRDAQAQARRADDLAQRWHTRLQQLTGQQPPTPQRGESEAAARHVDAAELARRVEAHEFDPPHWVTRELGARPEAPTQRRTWREALATLETYRTRWGIHDTELAIGQAPRSGPQRDEWQQARHVIDHAAPTRQAARSSDRDRDHDLEVDLG